MSRLAVTEDERQALNNLITAVSSSESFYCTGSAEYPDLENHSLMYLVEGGSKVSTIRDATFPLTDPVGLDLIRLWVSMLQTTSLWEFCTKTPNLHTSDKANS